MENGPAVVRPRWADLSNSDDDDDSLSSSASCSTLGDRSSKAPAAPARRPRLDPPTPPTSGGAARRERQRQRPEDLPEADALHRIEKRKHVIATVKQSKEYLAQRVRVAKTPDPTDRTFGKRRWDEAVVAWKMSLRSAYESDASTAPVDSDACRTVAIPAAVTADVPVVSPMVPKETPRLLSDSLPSGSSRWRDLSFPKIALLAILTLGQFMLVKRGDLSSTKLAIFHDADRSLLLSSEGALPLGGRVGGGEELWGLDLGEEELDDRYDLFLDADSRIDEELLSKRPVYQECHSTGMMMTTAVGIC